MTGGSIPSRLGVEPADPPAPLKHFERLDRLDSLRGFAVIWMAAFHACFDLNHLGLWQPLQNFYHDPFWTVQRTLIVSLFMVCALSLIHI